MLIPVTYGIFQGFPHIFIIFESKEMNRTGVPAKILQRPTL